MTYAELLRQGTRSLKEAGVADYRLDAGYLMEHVFDMDKARLLLCQNEDVHPEEKMEEYLSLINERSTGRPLQYITGKAYFMGLEFQVDENVLVPRQDTEVLCELAIDYLKNMEKPRLLDICTGSGCIVISLAHFCELGLAHGTDISEKALKIARMNARKLVPGKISFYCGDMFECISGEYDMIVSNPPYIPSDDIKSLMREVRDWEPLLALDGGEDGLCFYRLLCDQAPTYLSEEGWLIMETGYDQAEDIRDMMRCLGYRDVMIKKDYAGNNRVVSGRRPK